MRNKKSYKLLGLAVLLSTGFAFGQIYQPVATTTIPHVSEAITLDGVADEASWSEPEALEAYHTFNDFDGDTDFSGYFKTCYDLSAFYIYVEITDDVASNYDPQESTEPWQYDCVEVYFNLDTAGVDTSNSYADDGVQIRFNRGVQNSSFVLFGSGGDKAAGYDDPPLTFAHIEEEDKYYFEIRIPWKYALPSNTEVDAMQSYLDKSLGFEVVAIDNDSGSPFDPRTDVKVAWDPEGDDGNDDENLAWNDVRVFGIMQLESVPDEPVALAGEDQEVDEQTLVTLDASASYDPWGDTIKYSWESLDGIELSDSTAINPTFTSPNLVSGSEQYRFKLTVYNEGFASEPDTVTVTNIFINIPPVAVPGDDIEVDENTQFTLNGSASYDDDGHALTYMWSNTANIVIPDPTLASITLTAHEIEYDATYRFYLKVNDGYVTSDSVEVLVHAKQVNVAPVADAGADQIVAEGEAVMLDATNSSDWDNDVITYSWTSVDGITLAGPETTNPVFNAPEVDADTPYRFTLVVNDGEYDSNVDTVVVTVEDLSTNGINGLTEKGILVAPNPVSNVITVKVQNTELTTPYTIAIFDTQGKEVYRSEIHADNWNANLGSLLNKGIYSLQVTDQNNKVYNQQIVVE